MLKLICPDCIIPMKVIELTDFYCQSVSLQVTIEEQLCIQCGNSALQITDVRDAEDNNKTGRVEDLSVTCFPNKPARKIPQKTLITFIQEYFLQLVRKTCYKIFNVYWIYKFDIVLWELINSSEMHKFQYCDELKEIKNLANKLNSWVIHADSWIDLQNIKKDFVSLNTWEWMYKNQKKLLRHDNVRDPKTNTKSGS